MMVLKLILTAFLIMPLTLQCFGQRFDEQQLELMKKNNVKEFLLFNHSIDVQNDSFLMTKVVFDTLGEIAKIIDYDSIEHHSYFENIYNSDSSLNERITYFGKEKRLSVNIIYKYDKNGNAESEKHFTDKQLDFEILFKYDKKHRLETKETIINNSKKTTKYSYDSLNQVVKIETDGYTYPSIELEYDERGNHIKTDRIDYGGNRIQYLEMKYNENNQLQSQKEYHQYSRNLFGILDEIEIKNGDISVKKYTYLQNGLIEKEELFLNDVQVSLKKNKYVLQ